MFLSYRTENSARQPAENWSAVSKRRKGIIFRLINPSGPTCIYIVVWRISVLIITTHPTYVNCQTRYTVYRLGPHPARQMYMTFIVPTYVRTYEYVLHAHVLTYFYIRTYAVHTRTYIVHPYIFYLHTTVRNELAVENRFSNEIKRRRVNTRLAAVLRLSRCVLRTRPTSKQRFDRLKRADRAL